MICFRKLLENATLSEKRNIGEKKETKIYQLTRDETVSNLLTCEDSIVGANKIGVKLFCQGFVMKSF